MQLMQRVAFYKQIFDLILYFFFNSSSYRIQRSNCGMNIKVIVTVDTGDLLDDIRFHGNVLGASPARNNYIEYIVMQLNAEA